MGTVSDQHIIELETKLAYQEDLLQALNAVVANQQNQITRLEETCQLLSRQLKAMGSEAINQGFEAPPHY